MIGATVGSYQVREEIGHGGMGVVYVAEHPLIGRKVAVKVLLPEFSRNQEVVNRFFNEARATTMIRHPGLVDVIDFGYHADGSAYLIMEFLEGESLAARIKRLGHLSTTDICGLGRQVASAVGAAHEKGIIHRDLKPDNIFLVPDRELAGGTRVKILDFGIAKLSTQNSPGPDTPGGSLKTRTGVVMGTPLYMSPEQGGGASSVDARADVYSLGCILYEMACGRVPFMKEGFGEVIAAHIYEQPLKPREIEPSVSRVLEAVILRALAKKPDERTASMAALSDELAATAAAPAEDAADDDEDAIFDTPKNRVPLYIATAVALAGGIAIALVAHKPAKSAAATVTPPVAAVTAPAPVAPPPPPAAPAKVKLQIDSEPAGAEVFRAADGVLIGLTPLSDERAPSSGKAVYVLKLAGHQDGRAELAADKDGTANVALARLRDKPARAATPSSSKAPGRKRVRDGAVDPY